MSYEEDYRKPYRAKCACGQGFLRFYKIYLSNDWGQEKESATSVELFCECCKNKYHYERAEGKDYLVPNELSFPKQKAHLDHKYDYNEKEIFVQNYSKADIEAMVSDMTAPKHRYIKNLENNAAIEFATEWSFRHKKKSLSPMVLYLKNILKEYDTIINSYEQKKPYKEEYEKSCSEFWRSLNQVKKQSIELSFQLDYEQDKIDREKATEERERYEEEHRYDDFTAQVHYDSSYKKDFVNHFWDSYYIKECIDSQNLSLHKPNFGMPLITIAKKYACICEICGKEAEIISSDMKILYEDGRGFYPQVYCNCHMVSSFEAKTMDILNQLGITYIREKSFVDLVGDSGKKLRFDFALSKLCDEAGTPIIDLVIELQGPHHYKKGYYDEFGDYVTDNIDVSMSKAGEDKFARQCRYDEKKKEYCSQHGIKLECIKYTASNNYDLLERKITDILKKHGYSYYEGKYHPNEMELW